MCLCQIGCLLKHCPVNGGLPNPKCLYVTCRAWTSKTFVVCYHCSALFCVDCSCCSLSACRLCHTSVTPVFAGELYPSKRPILFSDPPKDRGQEWGHFAIKTAPGFPGFSGYFLINTAFAAFIVLQLENSLFSDSGQER